VAQAKNERQRVYKKIFDRFRAPVVDLDCGQKCKHLNNGVPICCDTEHAVPIMNKDEYKLLRRRSDLWRAFKPSGPDTQELVDSLGKGCKAVECKGAKFCERDNRSLSCRAFPFFPYITRDDEILGLAYYWTFEDRCWVISNLQAVTSEFVQEFLDAYDRLFAVDPEEREVFRDYSATMRRVFSRWDRPIYVIDANCDFLRVEPHGARVVKASRKELPVFEPYAD
jgi:hypothetical protein